MRDRVRPNGRGKDVHHARMRRGRRGGGRRRRREEEEDGRYRWIDPARVAKDIRVYEQDDGRRRRDARSDVRVFGDL